MSEIKRNLFEGEELSAQAKKDTLMNNAAFVEERSFLKEFTPDEMAEKKDFLVAYSIKKEKLEAELKAMVESKKAEIKEITTEFKDTLKEIREKGIWVEGDAYAMPDYDNRRMLFYDADGIYITERPMKPEERQMVISANSRLIND